MISSGISESPNINIEKCHAELERELQEREDKCNVTKKLEFHRQLTFGGDAPNMTIQSDHN